MTTYLNNYLDERYKTYSNDFYNGVVRVTNDGYYGTGSLLYDGKSILTAAHLFDSGNLQDIRVRVETSSATLFYNASVTLHPDYDSINANADLAILTLSYSALEDAQRYTLYRDSDEIDQTFTMVGYGQNGNGTYGTNERDSFEVLKLKSQNSFDSDYAQLKVNSTINWYPLEGSQLAADFDDGTHRHDTIGALTGKEDTGLAEMEGLIASGDSGGPAFIQNKVAGVATYVATISANGVSTDINDDLDSSFGEVGAWQRVSYYQEWIDKTIRESYVDAPSKREDVEQSIVEGDVGDISTTYFLLEYLGIREDIDEVISVDFSTRSATAQAGEDFISTQGSLILYKDETQALIPVEIIGDNVYEGDETFYLDIYNNSHGSLGDDVLVLTASRTIVDDDFLL